MNSLRHSLLQEHLAPQLVDLVCAIVATAVVIANAAGKDGLGDAIT